MSILQNSIDSIAIGLEDFNSEDHRRLISSTRNIFAGVLLLFKYKLSILSPSDSDEVLIKQKISPSMDSQNELRWVGTGKKTVDVFQIKERFKALGINVNWNTLDSINSYRNDIEHYYSSQSKSSIETLISSSFIIIRDFITEHLEEDAQTLLGKESWDTLVKISEVYQKEKDECIVQLLTINWESETLLEAIKKFKCTDCGSDLITVNDDLEEFYEDNSFKCRSCEAIYESKDIILKALEGYCCNYSWKDGEESNLITCPFCSEESYLYHEQKCILCKEVAVHECSSCFQEIPSCEITDASICSYCSYKLDKLMAE